MKNMNLLGFLSNRWIVACFSMMSFFLLGSTNLSAQNFNGPSTLQTAVNHGVIDGSNAVNLLTKHVAYLNAYQANFIPGTAKYDIISDAIAYCNTQISLLNTNPDMDGLLEALSNEKLHKAHPSILGNYSATQIAAFQGEMGSGTLVVNSLRATKLSYILDANAY